MKRYPFGLCPIVGRDLLDTKSEIIREFFGHLYPKCGQEQGDPATLGIGSPELVRGQQPPRPQQEDSQ